MSLQIGTHGIVASAVLLLLLAAQYEVVVAQMSPTGTGENQYGYAKVTPSMAIIIVVLIAALFFMGFFSVYIRHCSNSAGGGGSVRPLGTGAAGGRSGQTAATRGLDPAVIETFPTMVYSMVKGLKIGKGVLECAVCLNEFEDDETLRLIPKCDHVFHPECIDAWLESHTTCPVCRADLTPEPVEATPGLSELHTESEADLEAQNGAGSDEEDGHGHVNVVTEPPEQEAMNVVGTLNRSRTRGSRSGRPPKFPRSHTTGHSLVQPGENTDRFTLRLPAEVRKQIMMNQKLNRTSSVALASTKRLDQGAKSDRWIFNRAPSLIARASSFLTRATSVKSSPKVAAMDVDVESGGSTRSVKPEIGESSRPPV